MLEITSSPNTSLVSISFIRHNGHSLQTGSPYGLIILRFAFERRAGGRERESLQWSLYALSIYVQILNVNC